MFKTCAGLKIEVVKNLFLRTRIRKTNFALGVGANYDRFSFDATYIFGLLTTSAGPIGNYFNFSFGLGF
jgi:hypothetical protein